ncbi:TrbG/VirB9 family P-type conjugative transfer protein [Pseudoxanthomonas sp. JBR18]|uniref:TrbG/VirB9 family P-type conjugative transfer protein n=1 Tax=Pseudoxanthomonas sp. JBR18 TaxID=2969308 RepID=UPI0023068C2E|nr:TrbG/VirB9 family P-type conjugative transfer protein [Pseudoxanthomonas sp. JBR18]WCE06300.1 TrbG/VirB9 family P-type conjugative transfer protein [Pseudoxanthomonas sp. JBR18]
MFLMLLCALAWPASAQVIDRYEYKPDAIYQVRTGLGITTQIELSPNEQILDYSTGFSSGWELSRRENVFYLKPKNTDVDTNMMVRTATHSYIFELKVVATDWKTLSQARASGVQYKVSFVYSPETQFASAAPTQEVANKEPPEALDLGIDKGRRYYYDYSYATRSKAQWLIPTTVYDDGRFTYIKLNDGVSFPSGNFPTVYGRQEAHSEDFVVNTTVDKNTIVVHGTYPYLVIRHGLNVVGLRRNEQK